MAQGTDGRPLEAALVYSINARRGVPAGQTWGDFQIAMSQLGVRDSDVIGSIEYGIGIFNTGLLVRDDEGGQIEIREKGQR